MDRRGMHAGVPACVRRAVPSNAGSLVIPRRRVAELAFPLTTTRKAPESAAFPDKTEPCNLVTCAASPQPERIVAVIPVQDPRRSAEPPPIQDSEITDLLAALVLEQLWRIGDPMSVEMLTAAILDTDSRAVGSALNELRAAKLVRGAEVAQRWCLTPGGIDLVRDGPVTARRLLRHRRPPRGTDGPHHPQAPSRNPRRNDAVERHALAAGDSAANRPSEGDPRRCRPLVEVGQ